MPKVYIDETTTKECVVVVSTIGYTIYKYVCMVYVLLIKTQVSPSFFTLNIVY